MEQFEYTKELRRWYMDLTQDLNGTWTPRERAISDAVLCGVVLDEMRRVN